MGNEQESFEAAIEFLLGKFPSERSNKYDDDEFILCEKYFPQVLALEKSYNDSQQNSDPLKSTMDFVRLLANVVNAIQDNDTTNAIPGLLLTAESAYQECPVEQLDKLTWAFLQSLKCMHHFSTSEFPRSEREMRDGLDIRLELLPHDDLLIALGYSWLAMAIGAQERHQEHLDLLLKAGEILEGPAGDAPTRKLVWRFNTSRVYYCLGRYEESEELLNKAVEEATNMQSWYQLVYGHLTFVSLRIRTGRLDDAKMHVDISKNILATSGISARFSWLSSFCAYRAGDLALKQDRNQDAIEELERAVAIGKLVKAPLGSLARCTHAYSKALMTDPSRQEEAERQRLEARRLREQIPNGAGGNLDDESDEAFERLVKMWER